MEDLLNVKDFQSIRRIYDKNKGTHKME
jgi:hypothetical protein